MTETFCSVQGPAQLIGSARFLGPGRNSIRHAHIHGSNHIYQLHHCYYSVLQKFSATIEVILKFVTDLGIDLNATDNDEGKTPLHHLYSSRKASLVSQFLEAAQNEYGIGFDCNIVDLYGRTPIQ